MDTRSTSVPPRSSGLSAREGLIGSTGRHARVVLLAITEKEFPAARKVLEAIGPVSEVGNTGALTFTDCADQTDLPFVLVQATGRANLYSHSSILKQIRQFRPQHILVMGTAGGIQRPVTDERPYKWAGPKRGDVVVSEYIHYAEFVKISENGVLMRHIAMDQPSAQLVDHAHATISDGSWVELAARFRDASDPPPAVSMEEILCGEAVQDDPLDRMQQFLMKHFDRAGATEMESAGVAQCLHSNRESVHYAPGFLTIRGISDIIYARRQTCRLRRSDLPAAEEGKTDERAKWSPKAASAAAAFAVAVTARLVGEPQAAYQGHRAIAGYTIPHCH